VGHACACAWAIGGPKPQGKVKEKLRKRILWIPTADLTSRLSPIAQHLDLPQPFRLFSGECSGGGVTSVGPLNHSRSHLTYRDCGLALRRRVCNLTSSMPNRCLLCNLPIEDDSRLSPIEMCTVFANSRYFISLTNVLVLPEPGSRDSSFAPPSSFFIRPSGHFPQDATWAPYAS